MPATSARGRATPSPLRTVALRFAVEVDDEEVAAHVEHLPQVIVAVHADRPSGKAKRRALCEKRLDGAASSEHARTERGGGALQDRDRELRANASRDRLELDVELASRPRVVRSGREIGRHRVEQGEVELGRASPQSAGEIEVLGHQLERESR